MCEILLKANVATDEGEMKCEHWTKSWNWSGCAKLPLSVSWTYGLIVQSVRVSERNSVVVDSNHTQANVLWLLQKSFSGEYHTDLKGITFVMPAVHEQVALMKQYRNKQCLKINLTSINTNNHATHSLVNIWRCIYIYIYIFIVDSFSFIYIW